MVWENKINMNTKSYYNISIKFIIQFIEYYRSIGIIKTVSLMMDIGEMLDSLKKQRNRVIIINNENATFYKEYCEKNGIMLIDLSLTLSKILSPLSLYEKEQESWDLLKEWMETIDDDILAFYNIDYMFSPEVGNLDPVKNFNYYSRDKQRVILFINARRIGNLLIYSEEGLPDYNEMDISNNDYVLGWNHEN